MAALHFSISGSAEQRSEAGITIPFFAMLIAVFIMIASLVVDHSKEEIAVTNLQRSADAAALAAARQLNGRVDGWWESKKAAVAAVRRNPVHGANNTELQNLKLDAGEKSYWDADQNLSGPIRASIADIAKQTKKTIAPPNANAGIQGTAGGLNVKIERGLYWHNPKSPTQYSFSSLETDGDGLKGAVPFYFVANAVRVTVSLDKLNTVFGGVLGVSFFENLKRESIAVMDSELKKTVAPIGIPLCQLLFDTNPNVTTGNHIAPNYNSSSQCKRATYVAEANAKGEISTNLDLSYSPPPTNVVPARVRRDGLIRSESYERLPYTDFKGGVNLCYGPSMGAGKNLNCTALPLYGTLGVPATAPGDEATAEEVVKAITLKTTTAQIGSYFKPLLSLKGMSEDSVRTSIANAISSGPNTRSVRTAFMAGNTPKDSFPFGRTIRPPKPKHGVAFDPQGRPESRTDTPGWQFNDLNISAPMAEGIYKDKNKLKFQMNDMSSLPRYPGEGIVDPQLNYSNPMCHDDGIWHNDPDKARVLEMDAMVLAPGLEEFGGDIVRYCDFEKVFDYNKDTGGYASSKEQRAIAPIPDSKPVVVGFVKVNVFDFNFQNLATRTPGVADPRMQYIADKKMIGEPYDMRLLKQTRNSPVYLKGTGALYDVNTFALNFTGGHLFEDAVNNREDYKETYKDLKEKIEDWKEKTAQKIKEICIGKWSSKYPFCQSGGIRELLSSNYGNGSDSSDDRNSDNSSSASDGGGIRNNRVSASRNGVNKGETSPENSEDESSKDPRDSRGKNKGEPSSRDEGDEDKDEEEPPSANELIQKWQDAAPDVSGLDTAALDELLENVKELPQKWKQCFDFSLYENRLDKLRAFRHGVNVNALFDGTYNDISGDDLEAAISDLRSELDVGIRSQQDMHCMPRLKNGEVDTNNPDSFENLDTLAPGVGCGALRAKVDCDDKDPGNPAVIPTGKIWNENNPTLVSTEG